MIHQKIRHDPATALIRAVLTLARGQAQLEEHRGTSWASATFAGMRHVMRVSLSEETGMRTGAWLVGILPDHEFHIAGHLVADITVSEIHRRAEGTPRMTLTIEALTVEAD
jgi:hypothetical protein